MRSAARSVVWLLAALLVMGGFGHAQAQLLCGTSPEGEFICSGTETGGIDAAEELPEDAVTRLEDAVVTNEEGDEAIYNLDGHTLYIGETSEVYLEDPSGERASLTGVAARGDQAGSITVEGTVRVEGAAGSVTGVRLGSPDDEEAQASGKTVTNRGTITVSREAGSDSGSSQTAGIAAFGTGHVIVNEGQVTATEDLPVSAAAEPSVRGVYAAGIEGQAGQTVRIANAAGGSIDVSGQRAAAGIEVRGLSLVSVEQDGNVHASGRVAAGIQAHGDGSAGSQLVVTSGASGTVAALAQSDLPSLTAQAAGLQIGGFESVQITGGTFRAEAVGLVETEGAEGDGPEGVGDVSADAVALSFHGQGSSLTVDGAYLSAVGTGSIGGTRVLAVDGSGNDVVFEASGRAESTGHGAAGAIGAHIKGDGNILFIGEEGLLQVDASPTAGNAFGTLGLGFGVAAEGDDHRVTNAGTIEVSGLGHGLARFDGIRAHGERATIVNARGAELKVYASGGLQVFAVGIEVDSSGSNGASRITNAGSIEVTSGDDGLPLEVVGAALGINAVGSGIVTENLQGGELSATAHGLGAGVAMGIRMHGERSQLINAGRFTAEATGGLAGAAVGAFGEGPDFLVRNMASGRMEVHVEGGLTGLAAGVWMAGRASHVDNAGDIIVTASGSGGAAAGGLVTTLWGPDSESGDDRFVLTNRSTGTIAAYAHGPWSLAAGMLGTGGVQHMENAGNLAAEAEGSRLAVALGMLAPMGGPDQAGDHNRLHNQGTVGVQATSLDEDGRGLGEAAAVGMWAFQKGDELVNDLGGELNVTAQGRRASAAGMISMHDDQTVANAGSLTVSSRGSEWVHAYGIGLLGNGSRLDIGPEAAGRHGPPSDPDDYETVIQVSAVAPAVRAVGLFVAGTENRIQNAGTITVEATDKDAPESSPDAVDSSISILDIDDLPLPGIGQPDEEPHYVAPWTEALLPYVQDITERPDDDGPPANTVAATGVHMVVPLQPNPSGDVVVDNAGLIESKAYSEGAGKVAAAVGMQIDFEDNGSSPPVTITNSGRVIGYATGADEVLGVGVGLYGGSARLINTGEIEAIALQNRLGWDVETVAKGIHIAGGAADDRVEVINEKLVSAGTSPQHVDAAALDALDFAGTVALDNRGLMIGDIRLGNGADQFTARPGSVVEGAVLMGGGHDEVVIESGATVGRVDGGDGQDRLVLRNGAGSGSPATGRTVIEAQGFESTRLESGRWSVTGHSVLGTTQVQAGELHVGEDSVVSVTSMSVADGAILSGYGVVDGPVANAGILSPGSSIGTLTVRGDYEQTGGEFRIDLSTEVEDGIGKSDRLVVQDGRAVFAPGTVLYIIPQAGVYRGEIRYIVVEGDVELPVEGLTVRGPLFLDVQADAGSLVLTVTPKSFATAAATPNQAAVGDALTRALDDPDADLGGLPEWLFSLTEDDEVTVQQLYQALSGEVYTAVPTLAARRMDDQVQAVQQGLTAPLQELGPGTWLTLRAGTGRVHGTKDTAATQVSTQHLTLGHTLRQSDGFQLGLTAGIGTSGVQMPDRESRWEGTDWQVGAYVHGQLGGIQLLGVAGFQQGSYNSERTIRLVDEERLAQGSFGTSETVLAATARFNRLSWGPVAVTPVASAGWYRTVRPGFTEEGAGPWSLQVEGYEASWGRARVGVEIGMNAGGSADGSGAATSLGRVQPYGQLWWRVDTQGPERRIRARFVGAPGEPFDIQGAPWTSGGLEAAAGVVVQAGEALSWGVHYSGQFANDATHHRLSANVELRF